MYVQPMTVLLQQDQNVQQLSVICREVEKACIDICALSEVRRPGPGNIVERSHAIFWSGGIEKSAGVGLAISNKLVTRGINPIPINDRLMPVRIPAVEEQ